MNTAEYALIMAGVAVLGAVASWLRAKTAQMTAKGAVNVAKQARNTIADHINGKSNGDSSTPSA